MTKDEALRMALEALEADELDMVDDGSGNMVFRKEQAIAAIKKALSEPEQEPVAWMFQHDETGRMNYVSNDGIHDPTMFLGMNPRYALVCPLYTTPPQREFVGLTYEEKHEIRYSHMNSAEFIEFIEAKLKEKNLREQK